MRRIALVPVLLPSLLALVAASIAGAQPVLRYTWEDPANSTVNKDWTGSQTYTQTLSVTGLTAPIIELHVTVFLSMQVPEAWHMAISGPVPAQDCKGSPAFTAPPSVAGCQTIPGSSLTVVGSWFGITSPRPQIEVDMRFSPAFTPDPSVRYAIATFQFDHTHSATGSAYPDACGDADLPFCFVVNPYDAWLGTADFQRPPLGIETPLLSWQNALGTVDCNAAVPVRPSTWGQVKAIYR